MILDFKWIYSFAANEYFYQCSCKRCCSFFAPSSHNRQLLSVTINFQYWSARESFAKAPRPLTLCIVFILRRVEWNARSTRERVHSTSRAHQWLSRWRAFRKISGSRIRARAHAYANRNQWNIGTQGSSFWVKVSLCAELGWSEIDICCAGVT